MDDRRMRKLNTEAAVALKRRGPSKKQGSTKSSSHPVGRFVRIRGLHLWIGDL